MTFFKIFFRESEEFQKKKNQSCTPTGLPSSARGRRVAGDAEQILARKRSSYRDAVRPIAGDSLREFPSVLLMDANEQKTMCHGSIYIRKYFIASRDFY